RRQGEGEGQPPRRLDRRGDALGGEARIEDRLALVARRILDRATREARFGGEAHRLGDDFRRFAEAFFEIRRNRQRARGDDVAAMGERLLAAYRPIRAAEREGET